MLSAPKVSTVFGITKKTTSNTLNKAVIDQCLRNKTTSNSLSKEVLDLWKRKKNTSSLLNKTIIDEWQRHTLISSSKIGTYSLDGSITKRVSNEINPSGCYKICKCGNAESNLRATNKSNFSLVAQDNMRNFGIVHKYVIRWFGEAGKYSSLHNVFSGIREDEFKRAYDRQTITGCSFCIAAIITLFCIGVKSEEWLNENNEAHRQKPISITDSIIR